MEDHDLIFWTDIDTLIMNPNVRRADVERWSDPGKRVVVCLLAVFGQRVRERGRSGAGRLRLLRVPLHGSEGCDPSCRVFISLPSVCVVPECKT